MTAIARVPGKRGPWLWRWLGLGLVGLVVMGILAFAIFQPVKVLPRMQLAPGFSLLDQDGQPLTNESLRGHAVLYAFSYTRCPQPCSNIDATLKQVQEGLNSLDLGGLPVSLVTLSFDPEHDTPDVLQAHAAALGADPAIWRFATGDAMRLKLILGGGFEVYYAADETGGFKFDPALVLVDWAGIVRAKYDLRTTAPDADALLAHIALLAREAKNSSGAARLAYEAAHLFACYAP